METEETYNKNISACYVEDDIASRLIVATMTVCAKLGTSIDLLKIFDYYNSNKLNFFELNYVPNSKHSTVKAFYNCLTITFYINKIKISAKVFPNGSIQIPGCVNYDIIYKSSDMIHKFISVMAERCEGTVIQDINNFSVQNIRIVNIISNFTFNYPIIQERLKNIINKNRFEGIINDTNVWRIASFQPEKYSGINIKYFTLKFRKQYSEKFLKKEKIPSKLDGQISIFVFKSGKGTITGSKNTEELLESYMAIVNVLRTYQDELFIKDFQETGNKLLRIS